MSIDALNDNVNGRKVSLNQPQQQTTFKHDNTTNYRNNNNNSNRGNPPPKGWRETLDLGNVEELSIRIGGELISGGARAPKVNTPTVNREATSPPNPPPVIAHVDPTHSTDVKKAKPRGKTMQHRPYEGGVSISLPENTPSIQYSPHTYTPCEAVKPVICRRSSQSSPRCTHVASGHTDTGNSSPTSPGLAERAPRPLPPPQGQCYRANMLTGFYSGNEEPPLIVPQSLQRPAPRVENANNNTNTNPPNSNTNNDNWNHNRQPPCYNQNNNGRPMNGYPSGQGTPRHLNLSSPRGGRSGNFPPKMNIECFNQVQPFVPVWGYAPPTGGDSNANSANYNNSYNHTPNNNNNSNSNNYSRNSEHHYHRGSPAHRSPQRPKPSTVPRPNPNTGMHRMSSEYFHPAETEMMMQQQQQPRGKNATYSPVTLSTSSMTGSPLTQYHSPANQVDINSVNMGSPTNCSNTLRMNSDSLNSYNRAASLNSSMMMSPRNLTPQATLNSFSSLNDTVSSNRINKNVDRRRGYNNMDTFNY